MVLVPGWGRQAGVEMEGSPLMISEVELPPENQDEFPSSMGEESKPSNRGFCMSEMFWPNGLSGD